MTKRLFAYIGLSMLVSFAVVFYLGVYGCGAVCVFAVILCVCGIIVKGCRPRRSALVLISIALAASAVYSMLYTRFEAQPRMEKYHRQTVAFTGTLTGAPNKTGSCWFYDISTSEVNGNDEKLNIMLKSYTELDIEYNDTIRCTAVFNKCGNNYFMSKGLSYFAYPQEYYLNCTVTKAQSKGIGYIPIFIRQKLEYAVKVLVPGNEGDLCNAIALGDKAGIEDEIYKKFTDTGLSYIIVVSGMHMSIMASFVLLLLRPLGKKKFSNALRCITATLFVALFVAVTGFASSAVRSGVMIAVSLVGSALSARADIYNSLGFSAVILTILNPYAVGDIGMLLSFAAVLGIAWINPRIMEAYDRKFTVRGRLSRFVRYIAEMMSVSLSAFLAVTPLTLVFWGECNPLVIIFSLFITPLVSFLMIFALAAALLWYVPVLNMLAYPFGLGAFFIAGWIIAVVRAAYEVPFAHLSSNPFYMQIWLGITLCIIALCMFFKSRGKMVCFAGVLSLLLLIGGYAFNSLVSTDAVTLKVLNCGKGTTALLCSSKGCDILACGGDSKYSSDIVSEIGYQPGDIDFMIIPTTRAPDMRYSKDILKEFDVKSVLLYYKYSTSENVYRLARSCPGYTEFSNGDTVSVKLSGGINDTLINVNHHTWQYLTGGTESVLIAPYGGKGREVPYEYRNADVLVLNDCISDLDILNYGQAIWASSEQPPPELENYVTTQNGALSVKMK